MSPNEALFDSINRGDIVAAREALGRGADLNAQNVLGMTPLDLSIDLGRNDISFLLLSMRGEIHRGGPPGDAAAILTQSGSGKRKAAPVKIATSPGNTSDRVPRLFANDGGAPVPSAGFLGFDASDRAR
jgi:ankyrin repeat protein